jgi:hypothetical protein
MVIVRKAHPRNLEAGQSALDFVPDLPSLFDCLSLRVSIFLSTSFFGIFASMGLEQTSSTEQPMMVTSEA